MLGFLLTKMYNCLRSSSEVVFTEEISSDEGEKERVILNVALIVTTLFDYKILT